MRLKQKSFPKVCFTRNDTKYRFLHNFVSFYPISIISSAYQRTCRALHFRWKIILKKWKRKRRKGRWKFQLLYYLGYVVKGGIGGFPNPWPLQICKWFPTKIIISEDRSSYLHLIDLYPKNTFFSYQSGAENLFVLQK